MADNWIKMSVGLRRHPKVVRMASALKADRLRVVGALHAVWSVFDEHSPDGALDGYSAQIMDEEIGWKGFSAAMCAVEWLMPTESGLAVPRYDEHNGPTAKRRAQETKRKHVERNPSDKSPHAKRTESGQMSASDADKLRTREEEIRVIPSEANASGGKPPVDQAKTLLWQSAVSLLGQQGMPETQARTLFGKLSKEYPDGGIVLSAVEAAIAEQPADARAYLKATCQRLAGERKPKGFQRNANPSTEELIAGAL